MADLTRRPLTDGELAMAVSAFDGLDDIRLATAIAAVEKLEP